MRSKVSSLLVLALIVSFAGGSALATVMSRSVDDTAAKNWRTAAALEADNEYGTDGYIVYGLNADDNVYTAPFDTAITNTAASLVSLPAYISDITAANAINMWSGNGNFGVMQDPANGNAETNVPLLAGSAGNPQTFTIVRASNQAFRLTIMLADGDGALVTYDTTVDDGSNSASLSYTHSVDGLVYHVYDISAGASDVLVTVNSSNDNYNATGLAFDAAVIDFASNLVPADGATGVSITPTLTWTAGGSAAIIEHYVYLLDDPNVTEATPAVIPVASPAEYSPATLNRDATYYWRVDEKLNDGTFIEGIAQSFETVLSVPLIDASEPQRTLVDPGQSATLTVIATNPFTDDATGLSYQWKKYVDGVSDTNVGTNSDTYTFVVDALSEGYYYCIVTIDSNGATGESATVLVAPRKVVGNWPLDGDAIDASDNGWDGINADSTTQWVAGVTGEAGDLAADFNATDPNDFINVGNVPVTATGEMTVSFWAKPRDITVDWAGMVSKWSSDTEVNPHTFWVGQHSTDGALNYSIYLPGESRNVPTGVLANDTWAHFVHTYDGGFQRTYVNGLLAASVQTDTEVAELDGDLLFGQVPTGSMANYFNGTIDDVTVYNYAVNATEAADIYVAKKGSVCVERPVHDYDDDCRVTLADFAIFAADWLECKIFPTCVTVIE